MQFDIPALLESLDIREPCFRDDSCFAELSPELVEKAETELHEKAEWRKRDIEALRQMILSFSELNACLSDAFLLRFLRARKFDYDRAYKLFVGYFAARNAHPEIFLEFTPKAVENVLKVGILTPLFVPHAHDERVLLLRAGLWHAELCAVEDVIKVALILLELEITNELAQVNGFILVVDLQGVSSLSPMLKPSVLRRLFGVLQDSFPARLKAVHFCNEPALFSTFVTLFKPFLKEKLRQRLHFHGSHIEGLQQQMRCTELPSFLVVQSASEAVTWPDFDWLQSVLATQPYFEKLQEFGVVDSRAFSSAHSALMGTSSGGNGGAMESFFLSYRHACIDGFGSTSTAE